MYNRILQYSGIHYPHHIRSANEFVVRNDRRVPNLVTQKSYADLPIDLNFKNPNQHPFPLSELQRRIAENEFHRRQLVNLPLNENQLDMFDYYWDAYLFWNPSKRPPNYQVPDEDVIFEYNSNYNGPREITYEFQDQDFQRMNDIINRQELEHQHSADLFWNPSKRPANYQVPEEHRVLDYDKNYNGPREITYEYQTPHIRRQHANFVRRKQYLKN